jgi:hypothetical protein
VSSTFLHFLSIIITLAQHLFDEGVKEKKRPAATPEKSVGAKKASGVKLIRLDDLASRQDVRGGGKTFFGSKGAA